MSSNKTITTPASRRRGGEEVTPGLKVTEDLKLTVSRDERGRCRAAAQPGRLLCNNGWRTIVTGIRGSRDNPALHA